MHGFDGRCANRFEVDFVDEGRHIVADGAKRGVHVGVEGFGGLQGGGGHRGS